MPTLSIDYKTDSERILLEQAIAFVTNLHAVAQSAPVGSVLDACEQVAVNDGKKLLRSTLAEAVQARIAEMQKKVATRGPARSAVSPVDTRASTNEPC